MSKVIEANYRNPEFVQAVVGGLMYMGRIGREPVDEISAIVNAHDELVVSDGENTIIFKAFES